MQSKSAQAAVRGGKRKRNSADPAADGESVLREFVKSAKAASGGPQTKEKLSGLSRRTASLFCASSSKAQRPLPAAPKTKEKLSGLSRRKRVCFARVPQKWNNILRKLEVRK
jgi:hypothetical protein